MKKEKEIPLKNYILLSIVLILTIVVVIYFFLWKVFRLLPAPQEFVFFLPAPFCCPETEAPPLPSQVFPDLPFPKVLPQDGFPFSPVPGAGQPHFFLSYAGSQALSSAEVQAELLCFPEVVHDPEVLFSDPF